MRLQCVKSGQLTMIDLEHYLSRPEAMTEIFRTPRENMLLELVIFIVL